MFKVNKKLRNLLITGLLLFNFGCARFYKIPESSLSLEKRIQNSNVLIEKRKKDSESMTLDEKADYFEKRIMNEFRLKPYYLFSDELSKDGLEASVESTSLVLGALAFKFNVTKDDNDRELARNIIKSLIKLDKNWGYDGILPYKVRITRQKVSYGDKLKVTKQDMHSNAYSQLFFAYNLSYNLFNDENIKQIIKEHLGKISEYFIKNKLKLRNKHGKLIDYSNVYPSGLFVSGSRILDGLVFCESMFKPLCRNHANYWKIVEIKKRMIKRGYLNKIQNLNFEFLNFHLPTHGTDWLNFIRLYTVWDIAKDLKYKDAIEKLFKTQVKEKNPFFNIVYASVLKEPMLKLLKKSPVDYEKIAKIEQDAKEYLNSYPLNPDNSEIINSKNKDIKLKFISPIVKNKWIPEAEKALPIYARPLKSQEWKRNPFRVDGNFLKAPDSEKTSFSGSDFYLAYWMAKSNGIF